MWLKAIILGVIQGFTEFLPISSSGHLVLASEFLNLNAPGNVLEVMLHLGTLFSVIVCFWHKICYLIVDFFSFFKKSKKRKQYGKNYNQYNNLSLYLIIASIPAVITGLFLDNYFSAIFDKVIYTGLALFFTGLVLWFADRYATGRRALASMTTVDALIIGLWQSIAVLPGISRAGMTISAGFRRGLRKEEAVEWSFLMSIPIIAGATVMKLPQIFNNPDIQLQTIILGTLSSFLAGVFAIKLLLKIIKNNGWRIFAIYCWIVGSLIVIKSFI